MPIPSDLFTKALALLAFAVAFYALAARERKTPYITNFLYSSAFWILLSSFLQILAQLIETFYPRIGSVLQYIARGFLSELPEIMSKKIATKSSLKARWLCTMRLGE